MGEGKVATSTYDEHGWHVGSVVPWSADSAMSVLSPEVSGTFDGERWAHQGKRFFAAELQVISVKRYETGWPRFDSGELTVSAKGLAKPARIFVRTVPSDAASAVVEAARRAVIGMGGAGFDVLVARTKRVWQFRAEDDREEPGALLVAAIVASVVLGPVLAPDGALFGVKTARTRLLALGIG